MFYYIFLFCLLYGFWDGYKKLTENKKLSRSIIENHPQENYNGLLDFLTSNK